MKTQTKIQRSYDWNGPGNRTAHATTWDNALHRIDLRLDVKQYAFFNTDDLDFMITVFTQLKAHMEKIGGLKPEEIGVDGSGDTEMALLWYMAHKDKYPYWLIKSAKGDTIIKFVHDPEVNKPDRALANSMIEHCLMGNRYTIQLRQKNGEYFERIFIIDLT